MRKVVVGIISKTINSSEEAWLLVSSSKNFGKFTGFFYPPGGHIEKKESQSKALIREIKEELNLEANPTNLIAKTKSDIKGQATYWWKCEVHGEIKMSAELKDYRYFTKNQIIESKNIWPATKYFFIHFIFSESMK